MKIGEQMTTSREIESGWDKVEKEGGLGARLRKERTTYPFDSCLWPVPCARRNSRIA